MLWLSWYGDFYMLSGYNYIQVDTNLSRKDENADDRKFWK